MVLESTIRDRQLLLDTDRFRVERVRRILPDGVEDERAIVRHPGAVAIVPLLDPETVCLIRNWRVAVERPLIELPAGTLEPGEAPDVAAVRELAEETGYRAEKIEPLGAFFLSPGIMDERMHLFLASPVHPGPIAREAGEQIENLVLPWSEALRMVHAGEIEDAKTIVGLLLVAQRQAQSGTG